MWKRAVTVLCVAWLICWIGDAMALSYDELTPGMKKQEVLQALSGYEIRETETERAEYVTATGPDVEIRVSFSENTATIIRFKKVGEEVSDIDYFIPDWSLSLDKIISILEENGIEYYYRIQINRFKRQVDTDYIQYVEFTGQMGDVPVDYYIVFDGNGEMAQVQISPAYVKNQRIESNGIDLIACLGATLGLPEKSKVNDYSGDTDGSVSISDTATWTTADNEYKLEILTGISQEIDEDRVYLKDCYREITITIVPLL